MPDDLSSREELTTLLSEQSLIRKLIDGSSRVILEATRESLKEAERSLEASIKLLKRKVELFDMIMERNETYSLFSVENALDLRIGQKNSLFRELRKRGYLIRSGAKKSRPEPYWIERGVFTNARSKFVTQKGLIHLWDDFRKNPVVREA